MSDLHESVQFCMVLKNRREVAPPTFIGVQRHLCQLQVLYKTMPFVGGATPRRCPLWEARPRGDYVQDERYIAGEHMDVRRDCVSFARR